MAEHEKEAEPKISFTSCRRAFTGFPQGAEGADIYTLLSLALLTNIQAVQLPNLPVGFSQGAKVEEQVGDPYINKPLITETETTSPVLVSYNHFPKGWCTWWVASKRNIPWHGNAGTWLIAAKNYGYLTSNEPVAGAILVTREGSIGHVAYVESVSRDNRTFVISEMNYIGFNRINYRTLPFGYSAIKGFVY